KLIALLGCGSGNVDPCAMAPGSPAPQCHLESECHRPLTALFFNGRQSIVQTHYKSSCQFCRHPGLSFFSALVGNRAESERNRGSWSRGGSRTAKLSQLPDYRSKVEREMGDAIPRTNAPLSSPIASDRRLRLLL